METRDSISQWTDETFGRESSDERVAVRALEEAIELVRELSIDRSSTKIGPECADVCIVLCRLGVRLDFEMEIGSEDIFVFEVDGEEVGEMELALEVCHMLCDLAVELDPDAEEITDESVEIVWDVLDRLRTLVKHTGSDLQTEVDKKMQINRARRWTLDGSGHGYHVREAAEESHG